MDSKDALVKLVSDRIDASIEEIRAELEERLIKMVPEAESKLKSAGEVLKTELQAVAEFPADFVTFYLEKRPRLWQSKRAFVNLSHVNTNFIVYGCDLMGNENFNLAPGAYRFVVMAVPLEKPTLNEYDDYGVRAHEAAE